MMGSSIKPTQHPGEITINNADLENVSVTNLVPGGRAFVMKE